MLKPIKSASKQIFAASFAAVVALTSPDATVAAPQNPSAQQASTTATGVVKDELGEPMIGATVRVVGKPTKVGATNIDGEFSISNMKTGEVLEITSIGYDPVKVTWNGTPLDIQMNLNAQQLGEVVVTAMGIQRKESSLTYATQSIKGDELMRVQDANFVNALSGKVSGVTITQSAGGAGGKSKILLRGNKSIMGNNEPLVVIDGIPMSGSASGGGFDGGSGLGYTAESESGDVLSLINPDDIESINVLKGANAAALYGSAAANGVLMITTKKGRQGTIGVTVNSNVTFERPLVTPEIQRIYGSQVTVIKDSNDGTIRYNMPLGAWGTKIGEYTDEQLAYPGARLRNYAADDVSEFFRTGTTWNNSIAIQGGTEKVKTYFSYANSNAKGMMPGNSYNRNTFSFRQSYNMFDNKLKADVSINYVYARSVNRPGGGTVLNPLYDLYRMPGNIDFGYYRDNYYTPDGTWESNKEPYWDKDGKIKETTIQLSGPQQNWAFPTGGNNNPYWLSKMNRSENVQRRAYGSGVVSYEIIPGLMVQGRLNIDYASSKSDGRVYATTWYPTFMHDYGLYSRGNSTSTDWYVDAMASYNKTFNEIYSVSASSGWVGHTSSSNSESQYVKSSYYPPLTSNSLPTLVNYFHPDAYWWTMGHGISYGKSKDWNQGWFITGQVGYNDMVYLEGSYRIDWYRAFRQFSDRGTPDHYGYWSIGANTLVHRYVKLPDVITHLKLRASYSEVGNSIPNQVYASATRNLVNGALTSSPYGYFDNPLPEKQKSFEIGYDISLFNSNLNWDMTYYNTNLTNSYFLAATTGGKSKPVNTGSIRNQGFETTVSYNIMASKDFMWRTGINLSYNDNKILKTFKDEQGNPSKMEQLIAEGSIAVRYEEGASYGDMYGLDFRRNDDGTIYIDPALGVPIKDTTKFIYLGNMNSKWNLGWSNTLRWKDLSLYFLISGRIGGKFISLTEAYLDHAGTSQRSADARLRAEREGIYWTSTSGVQKPGMYVDGVVVPVKEYYEMVGGQVMPSEYIYDATNFRLSELSISYTMRNLFKGVIKGITLSAVGRNLFFIYKKAPSDPDIALSTKNGLGAFDIFNMPSARSYGINLKIEF